MSLGYVCCLDWWLNSDSLHVLYPSVDFSSRPPLTYGPHFPVTPLPFVAPLIHFGSASSQFTWLHSFCIPQGEGKGGGGEVKCLMAQIAYTTWKTRHQFKICSLVIVLNCTNLRPENTLHIYMFKNIPTKDSKFSQLPKSFEMEFGP